MTEFIYYILFFGALGALTLTLAKMNGFFKMPYGKRKVLPLSGSALCVFFAIYLASTLLLAPGLVLLAHKLYGHHPSIPLGALSTIQLITLSVIFLFFFLYARAYDLPLLKNIGKTRLPEAASIPFDIGIGALTWLIAFPPVAALGEFIDLLIYTAFGVQNYEQVAVRYLKHSITSVEAMIIPLLTILLAAPIIEEFLFRGCLQTYLKQKVGIKAAITLSSVCFALFHFAPSQGIGNVSLLLSLFVFALFLGFIYERQASLFASISLHVTFNTLSTIRIIFFPD